VGIARYAAKGLRRLLRNRLSVLREMDLAVHAWRWDCCHFSAPHRGGPDRAAPNISNNETVFTVF